MFSPLFTGRLTRLTAPRPEDKALFAMWSQDDDYMRHLDDDPIRPLGESAFASFDEPAAGSHYFHVRALADDRLLGFIVLFNIKWSNQSAEMAIGIGNRTDRGRGYGQDALMLLLRYAFDELNLHRVGLTVMAYNTAAIRLYERTGFVFEGAHRAAVQRAGVRNDLLCYGILRPEWKAGRATSDE
mgnify:CR=1 FL=1